MQIFAQALTCRQPVPPAQSWTGHYVEQVGLGLQLLLANFSFTLAGFFFECSILAVTSGHFLQPKNK